MASAASIAKLKVVVIDDNHHMRALLHSVLSAFGIRNIVGVQDGGDGFAAVQKIKPDFVVTDFTMHPVDGVEFVKMVRALHTPIAWVPIIMITGHGERQYVERARDAGVTEFLIKPVTPRGLFLRIQEVIERPRPFVKSPAFIGPDRRRRHTSSETIPKRRESDGVHVLEVQ